MRDMQEISTRTGNIRWYVLSKQMPRELQEEWQVIVYENGDPYKRRLEWRPVPTVESPW